MCKLLLTELEYMYLEITRLMILPVELRTLGVSLIHSLGCRTRSFMFVYQEISNRIIL